MATTVLNSLILQASRSVQEYRASAAATDDAGRRWKSSNWTDYANRAVREYLLEKMMTLGANAFMEAYPEYVKESGVLVTVAGSVAMPSDALMVVELCKSDYTIYYDRLDQEKVYGVKSGRNPLNTGSATHPKFWEENGFIKTNGILAGNVIARYIVSPTDLAVITAAAGNGKKNSANGSWTAATNTLTIAMAGNFVAGTDENRGVMFFDNLATKVYFGRIASIPGVGSAVLYGDGLPAADIANPNVTIALMEQVSDPDVKLNALWHGEIIERMAKMALNDALTK